MGDLSVSRWAGSRSPWSATGIRGRETSAARLLTSAATVADEVTRREICPPP